MGGVPRVVGTRWRAHWHRRGNPRTADGSRIAAGAFPLNVHLIAALQSLPAEERAVVFLHDVLRWENQDVAELLGTSPERIDIALQRARATLAATRAR